MLQPSTSSSFLPASWYRSPPSNCGNLLALDEWEKSGNIFSQNSLQLRLAGLKRKYGGNSFPFMKDLSSTILQFRREIGLTDIVNEIKAGVASKECFTFIAY
jgi:hypothetical protein